MWSPHFLHGRCLDAQNLIYRQALRGKPFLGFTNARPLYFSFMTATTKCPPIKPRLGSALLFGIVCPYMMPPSSVVRSRLLWSDNGAVGADIQETSRALA